MRIISKYHDYYDHMAHVYGVDEKTIYERKDLGERVVAPDMVLYRTKIIKVPDHMVIPEFHRMPILVAMNRVFPLYKKWTSYRILTPEAINAETERGTTLYDLQRTWRKEDMLTHLDFLLTKREPDARCTALTRLVGDPIYIIDSFSRDRTNTVYIAGNFHTMAEIGLPRYYPADQFYQDLSYYLANTLNESPDVQPAGKPPLTDKEKIVQHGFDTKASFRHRK